MRSANFSGNGFVHHVYKWLQSAAHSITTFLNSFGSTRLQKLGAAGPAAIDRSLLPHEELVISQRQHPAILVGPSALAFVGLLAAFVLTIFVYGNEALVLAVWIAWLLLFLRLIWKAINWMGNYFVVTSERMLLVSGLAAREVAMIPLWSTNDLSFSRSFGGRLFGYGDFIIEYSSQDSMLTLNSIDFIPNPEQNYLDICAVIFRDDVDDVETITCPICNGDGRIFRRAHEEVEMPDHAGDHPAGNLGQDKADLLARGYEEAACPRCDGQGTVSAPSRS
jgi:Bacterial PH domain